MTISQRMIWAAGLTLIGLGISPSAAAANQQPTTTTIVCGSKAGEREVCAANTSGGVTLVKSLGPAACELGRTWGWDQKGIWVSDGCGAEFSVTAATPKFGQYTPGVGFTVANTDQATLNIRVYGYLRYLNQKGTDDTYANAFGKTSDVQQRQDFQLNKAQVYFFGWALDPKFRYTMYVWTSNTSLGQTSQVVVAGNLKYAFSERFTVGGGVNGLPGTRSTTGNFPHWLSMDSRLIADEFFRPSYTTGFWVEGHLPHGVTYTAMLGNNLSQFGIDAGQLDPGMDTVSAEIAWMPTTGEFGRTKGFGDFDWHEAVATRVAAHITRSTESRQAQPTTDAFDNVQLRVSDGSIIFAPNLFLPDSQIDQATYQMVSVDAGVKYRGFAVEGEYYWRRLNDFQGRGLEALPFSDRRDHGFQLQASAMAVPKFLQVYASGSKVFGQYGDPSDFHAGATFFPWKNEVVRWNFEFMQMNRSPVGALSLPYSVGSNGPIFHTNFMVWF